jgi:hypothetical protein
MERNKIFYFPKHYKSETNVSHSCKKSSNHYISLGWILSKCTQEETRMQCVQSFICIFNSWMISILLNSRYC